MAELTGTGNFDYTNFSGWSKWETRWKDIGVALKDIKFHPVGAVSGLGGTPYGNTGEFFTRVPHNVDQYNYLAGLVNSIDVIKPVSFIDHFPHFEPYTSGHFIVPKDLWSFETKINKKSFETITLTYESGVTWPVIRSGMVESGNSTDLFGATEVNPGEMGSFVGNPEHGNPASNLGITHEDDLVSYYRYNSQTDGNGDHNIWVINFVRNITGYVSSFVHSRYGTEYNLATIRDAGAYDGSMRYSNLLFEANWMYDKFNAGVVSDGNIAIHEKPMWKTWAERMGMSVSSQTDLPNVAGQDFGTYFEKSGNSLEIYSAIYDYQIKGVGKPVASDSNFSDTTGLGILRGARFTDNNVSPPVSYEVTSWPGFTDVLKTDFYPTQPVGGDSLTHYTGLLKRPETSQSFYATSGEVTLEKFTKNLIDPEAYVVAQGVNIDMHNSRGLPLQENRSIVGDKQTEVDWIVKKEKCSNGKWVGLGYGNQTLCEDGVSGPSQNAWVDSTTLPFTHSYVYSIGNFKGGDNFLWSEDTVNVDQKYKNHGLYGLGKSYEGTAPTGSAHLEGVRRLTASTHSSYFWGDPMLTCQRVDQEIDITDTYCCPKYWYSGGNSNFKHPVNECWANSKWVTKLGGLNVGYEPWYNPLLKGFNDLSEDNNILKAKNLLINTPYPQDEVGFNVFLDESTWYGNVYGDPHHWNSYSLPPYKGAKNKFGFDANGVEDFYWVKTNEIKQVADKLGLPLELRRMSVPYKFKEFNFTYTPTQKSIIPTGDIVYDKRIGSVMNGDWTTYGNWISASKYNDILRTAPMNTIGDEVDPKPSAWTKARVRQDHITSDNHANRYDWEGYNSWIGMYWLDTAGYQASDFGEYNFDQALPNGDIDKSGLLKINGNVDPNSPLVTVSDVTGYSPIVKQVGQFILAEDIHEAEWVRPIPLGHHYNVLGSNNSFKDFPLYSCDFVKSSNDLMKAHLKTTATWSGNWNYGFWLQNDESPNWPENMMMEVVDEEYPNTADGYSHVGYNKISAYRTYWFWGMKQFYDNPINEILVDSDDYKKHISSIILNLYPKNLVLEQIDEINSGVGSAVFRHYHSDAIYLDRGDDENYNWDNSVSWIFGRPDRKFGQRLWTNGNYTKPNKAENPQEVIVEQFGKLGVESGFYRYKYGQGPTNTTSELPLSGSYAFSEAGRPMVPNPVPLVETEFLKREVKRFNGAGEMLPLDGSSDGTISRHGDYLFFNNDEIFQNGAQSGIGRVEYGFYINNGFKVYGSGLSRLAKVAPRKWEYPDLNPRILSGQVQDSYPPHGPYPNHGIVSVEDSNWTL